MTCIFLFDKCINITNPNHTPLELAFDDAELVGLAV